MKLRERFRKAGDLIFGNSSYDAANYSPRRSRVPGSSPSDFKHDFQGGTRLEIVQRSRYLMKNSGLPREVRDLNILYAVGPEGLCPVPHLVEDSGWVNDAKQYFNQWALKADVTERFTFTEIQKLCSAAIDTDGEIFPVKTRSRATGEPRLQLIETHRVGNFLDHGSKDERWVDGIRVDAAGKPIAIKVLLDNGKTRNIPWGYVMHLFDPESPSAYRHPPTLTHSVNHLLDEIELLALEKHAVKDNADIARVLKTEGGNLDDSGDFSVTGGSDAAPDGTDPKALQKIVGGKLVSIHPHESIEAYESNRPSPTFTGFLDHLRRDSALGALPYEFAVDPSDSTGPAIRMIVAKAQRRFRQRTELITNRLVRPTWFYVIGTAIDNGELPAIKNWSKVRVTPPKDITVDAGRDSEANRRDVQMGLKLPTTSYEEQGEDFLESMESKAKLIKAVDRIAEDFDVDPKQLFDFMVSSDNGTGDKGSAGTPPSGGKSDDSPRKRK